MKQETLKNFIEECFKKNSWYTIETVRDLIELEAIEQRLNVIWGVKLEIKIEPSPKLEGRFYGKSLIKAIEREQRKYGARRKKIQKKNKRIRKNY